MSKTPTTACNKEMDDERPSKESPKVSKVGKTERKGLISFFNWGFPIGVGNDVHLFVLLL